MLRFRHLLASLAILIFSTSAFAQDIHFTQYNMSPLTLNPSLTGAFEGTFRVGGLYRDQWRSVTSSQFVTPSVYVDAPVFRGIGKNDWIGVGAVLVNDKAGTVSYTNTIIMGNIAYHLALGSKGKTVVSLGLQGGIIQKRIDKSNAEFADELALGGATGTSADLNTITNDKLTYGDFNTGISLNSVLNKNMDFNVGFSLFHLAQPNYSVYLDPIAVGLPDDETRLPRRIVGHATFNADLAPKWTLSPTVLYQTISGADEVMIQTMAGYHFNVEKDVTLRFGAGYRLSDAAQAMLGFDYKGLRLGVAYDVNVSTLDPATNNRGGFEVAASYIAKIFKTPVVKPVIFCPRF